MKTFKVVRKSMEYAYESTDNTVVYTVELNMKENGYDSVTLHSLTQEQFDGITMGQEFVLAPKV